MPGFLDLPRELRDNIYDQIIVSRSNVVFISTQTPGGHIGPGRLTGRIARYGTTEYLDTALLYVCRSVSAEATHCLYSGNTFSPASTISQFVVWLRGLKESSRASIRKLDFMSRLFMPLLFDNTAAWKDLMRIVEGEYGNEPMHLTSISVNVPMDFQLYQPSPALGLRKLLANSEQFWWPHLKFFVELFMNGRTTARPPCTITSIKLIFPSYENSGVSRVQAPTLRDLEAGNVIQPNKGKWNVEELHPPSFKELDGPVAFDLEDLESVRRLRVPRVAEEDETEEEFILKEMMSSGTRSPFTRKAWNDFYAKPPRTDRELLDFDVRWQTGEAGKVLILQ